jgi:hypothetical protein
VGPSIHVEITPASGLSPPSIGFPSSSTGTEKKLGAEGAADTVGLEEGLLEGTFEGGSDGLRVG